MTDRGLYAMIGDNEPSPIAHYTKSMHGTCIVVRTYT